MLPYPGPVMQRRIRKDGPFGRVILMQDFGDAACAATNNMQDNYICVRAGYYFMKETFFVFTVVLLFLAVGISGCTQLTAGSETKEGGVNGLPVPVVGDKVAVGATGTIISIAVKADEITTPYPDAKEFFLEGLNSNSQENQFEKAIECYDKALEIDPEFSEAWFAKGVALHNMQRYNEAIECYDSALALNSQNAAIWAVKGTTLEELGRSDEAAECYGIAAEMDPLYARV
jgi:tetratricopeptide (TPR) repeat protein